MPLKIPIYLIGAKVLAQAREKNTLTDIGRALDCQASSICKVIQKLEGFGLIAKEKKGRANIITLTKKGEEISRLLEKVLKAFE